MIIFPAIDIKNGKCVRLYKGLKDKETIYEESPIKQAESFVKHGATHIHIVDLDAAFTGEQKNFPLIKEIANSFDITIQTGGGIRSLEIADKLFECGISRIVLGTILINKRTEAEKIIKKHGDVVILGLDCKGQFIATEGWEKSSDTKATEVISHYKQFGVKEAVYTNIEKDGTLEGSDISSALKLAQEADFKVILSGGVADINDIIEAKKHQDAISGVITGKALYENRLSLKEALEVAG